MAWAERTVKCPECATERITKAGTGTKLGCISCGVKFAAPPPAVEPAPPAATKPGVKRAKATATVVRKNARPRPKTSPAPATPAQPVTPPTLGQEPTPAPVGDPPAAPATPATTTPDPAGTGRQSQRAAGRRGGLAYYRHLVGGRKAS